MEDTPLKKCHIFICYRQQDGLAAADWLYQNLHGRTIQLERSHETLQLDVYLDRDAPAVDDWQEIWLPKLQVARALVFVCTPSAAKQRDGTDWVYRELDKWIAMRQSGPIVIDATGAAEKYLPRIIKERWPNAQQIVCRPDIWEKLPEEKRRHETERVISRILRGIRISEEGYWLEELERLKALNRKLVRRLAAVVALFGLAVVFGGLFLWFMLRAEREATIALAGQLTAKSEFLRQQEGPSLETSVLMAMRAYALRAEVGAPSVGTWRALDEGIKLLPGKIGESLYPFGRDVGAKAYVGENAVLFVRQQTSSLGADQAVLWSFDKVGSKWHPVRRFTAAEHGKLVSVNADGRRIVAKRADGYVVWNTLDGEVVYKIPHSFESKGAAMVPLSQSGKWLGWIAGDKLHVFNLQEEGAVQSRVFTIGWQGLAVFSPSERHIACADADGLVLYSLESGEILRKAKMPPGTDQVGPLKFSPDGKYLAVHVASNQTVQMGPRAAPGGVNHKAYIWRVSPETGRSATAAVDDWVPYEMIVREDRFNLMFGRTRDNPKLVILERSQPVQVLDLFSKVSFTLSAGDQGARNAAFEEGQLLTVNRDGTARLWDTQQRIERMRLTQNQPVHEAHLLSGRGWGRARILTVADDGEVRLWGRPKASPITARGASKVMAWSSSGGHILSAAGGYADRIDARTGERVPIPLGIDLTHVCVAGALSPDGRHAVLATKWAPPGQPQTLRLVDLDGGHEEKNLGLDQDFEVRDLAVGLGGSPVLAKATVGAVLVWTPDATAEGERLRIFRGVEAGSNATPGTSIVLLDPAGDSFLRIFGGKNTTLIRQANTGKILGELQLPIGWNPEREPRAWRWSYSGRYLSLPSGDGQFFLVETRKLVATKIASTPKAQLLQVANDGRLLLRSEGAFVVVNQAGDTLYRIADTSMSATGQLGGDGQFFVVMERDGAVAVWDLENGLPLAGLSANNEVGGAMFGPGGDQLILFYPRSFLMRHWKGEALVGVASALIGRELTQDEWQTHVGSTPMR